MPRFKWIYLEGDGVQHHVELFHGRMKGHVLISCNGSILVTDFDVRQSKSYTFFINEELCKIHMKRKGLKFTYNFEIDKKANTPLNQLRRERQNRYNVYMGLLILGIVIICSVVVRFNRKVHIERTGVDPWLAYSEPKPEYEELVHYGRIHRSSNYEHSISISFGIHSYSKNLDGFIAINGWPFEAGQEYAAQLRNGDLIVDWHKPSDKTLNEFRSRAFEQLDYEELKLKGYTNKDCVDSMIANYTTAYGLASFMFSDLEKDVNEYANNESYIALLRSDQMKETYNQICEDSLY